MTRQAQSRQATIWDFRNACFPSTGGLGCAQQVTWARAHSALGSTLSQRMRARAATRKSSRSGRTWGQSTDKSTDETADKR